MDSRQVLASVGGDFLQPGPVRGWTESISWEESFGFGLGSGLGHEGCFIVHSGVG